jgi:hypothetical protein
MTRDQDVSIIQDSGRMPSKTLYVGRKRIGKHANDADVRTLLKEFLSSTHAGTGTLVLDELGLCQGDVRVDVAVVNGELTGFEIKSPSDTLARWEKQRRIYSKVVDRAWLVASTKTLDSADAPAWWGRIAIFELGDRLALRIVKPADSNPKPDALSIARLLWRDEALATLKRAGCARGVMTKPRRVIWRRLIESVTIEELRASVRTALKQRPDRVAALKK